MAPGRQASLTQVGWEGRARRTRRAEFLGQTGPVVPWADLLALVEPPGTGAGRQPWPAETPPGTRPARCRPDLTGVACEDACHDSLSVRDFVGCRYRVPDATTPGDFRHLPGESDVGRALLDVVVARLEAGGLVMRGGSVVDATIIKAPSSTKNASGSRDPETRQTKKGNRWHLGTRCHSGEDAGSGYVHSATLAAANVPDVCEAHGLVRDDDGLCHADAGWRGVARREEVRSDPHPSGAGWRVAMGPSRPGAARRARWDGRGEGRSRGLRAREGKRPCQIARRTLGYARVRYRGIARGGECASPPCPPAPTCPCAPGPGGRGGSWVPPWRPPDGGRGDCVPRGRPEGPGTPGKAAAVRI